jgi:hypothetical protein
MILKKSEVRALIRAHGKRAKPEFIEAVSRYTVEKIEAACRQHNGGAKTLDAFIAAHVFGKTNV